MATMNPCRKAPSPGDDHGFDSQVLSIIEHMWEECFSMQSEAYREYLEATSFGLDDDWVERKMHDWRDEQMDNLRQEIWEHDHGWEPEPNEPSLESENEQLRNELNLQKAMRKAIQEFQECPNCGKSLGTDEE